MTIRIILKNGSEFSVKCKEFAVKRNELNEIVGYEIKGIEENKPLYIDFNHIAAIVRVFSDEKTGEVKRRFK